MNIRRQGAMVEFYPAEYVPACYAIPITTKSIQRP